MINIHVSEQQILTDVTAPLVAEQINYVAVHAYFDNTWAKLSKTIQIRQGENLIINKKLGDVDMANFYMPAEIGPGPIEIAALGTGDDVSVTTSAASLYVGKSGYNMDEIADKYDVDILGYRYAVRVFDGSEATGVIAEVSQVPESVVILPENANVTWGMNDGELTIYGLPADTTTTVTAITKLPEPDKSNVD